eukprot:SAG11_NODE_29565_length_309_cov_1.223810_1_plen_29_part_10
MTSDGATHRARRAPEFSSWRSALLRILRF